MVAPGTQQPFAVDGGPTGVLLCHGYTGTPASMRPWADHLAAAGLSVRLPLLPGHGTSWRDLNRTEWPDWFAAVQRALLRLAERCDTVVVAGLSMGGCLALRLAEVHPDVVAGLVLVNPAVSSSRAELKVLRPMRLLVPSVAGLAGDVKKPGAEEFGYPRNPLRAMYSLTRLWRVTAADLHLVTQPVLLFRSVQDHVVDPGSAALIRSRVPGPLTERPLRESYHVATLDYDAETIFSESLRFIRQTVVAAPAGVEGGG